MRSLAIAGLALLLCAGCEDLLGGVSLGDQGGGGGGNGGPVTEGELEGIQAFGTVIRAENGVTYARLDVLTLSGEPHFLSGIVSPTIQAGSTVMPLVTGSSVGVFETTSNRSSALTYQAGGTYVFRFDIIDEDGTTHSFESRVTAPDEAPIAEAAVMPIRFAGEPVEVELRSMGDGGSFRVANANGVTYDTSSITTLAQVANVRARMEALVGPVEEIPGAAFPTAGVYTIEVTSMDIGTGGSGLGTASWFGAGLQTSFTITVE